jgi:hypothetical protein
MEVPVNELEREGGMTLEKPERRMSDWNAQLIITKPRREAPDFVASGRVDCPCGLFFLGPCKGPPGFSMQARCPSCLRWLESLPMTEGDDK